MGSEMCIRDRAEESRAAQASFTAKKAGRVVDAPPTTLDAGNVVPLRPHRPTLRHLGVAAAVVTAIGLGLSLIHI